MIIRLLGTEHYSFRWWSVQSPSVVWQKWLESPPQSALCSPSPLVTSRHFPSQREFRELIRLVYQFFYFKDFIYLFLGRRERRKKERERNIDVQEIHWSIVSQAPLLGTWPTTQACALTGNWTGDLWFTSWHSIHWTTSARASWSQSLK